MLMLLRLGLRNLARNKRRSALTLLSSGVGVAMIIIGSGLMFSFLNAMVDDVVERRLGALVVRPRAADGVAELLPLSRTIDLSDTALITRVTSVPFVTAWTPRIRFAGLLGNGTSQVLVIATAIAPDTENKVCSKRTNDVAPQNGSALAAGDTRALTLSAELARGLGGKPGGSLVLQASGAHGATNALDVDVKGVTAGAGFMEAKSAITVPLAFAQELLHLDHQASEIALAIDDPRRLADVKEAVGRVLPDELEVVAWPDVVPFLRDTQLRMKVVLSVIGFVLFAIAIFGVVNTMLMSVHERVREIGTLLSIGFRRWQVTALFLIEGAVLGALGGTVGGAVGTLVSLALSARGLTFSPPGASNTMVLHPTPLPFVVVLAVTLAVVGAFAAAAWPARRAAQLNPVDALRGA